jgi:hypothetical protein
MNHTGVVPQLAMFGRRRDTISQLMITVQNEPSPPFKRYRHYGSISAVT